MFGNVIYIFVAQCGSLSVLIFYDQEIADKHRRTEIIDGTDFRRLLEKTFIVTKRAFDEGVFINSVIPPACAPQDTLIRFSLMATHTREQVDRAVDALTKVFREEGIIK